jgi:peptidoglycan/LPS O-acetylase OafA/YrhL
VFTFPKKKDYTPHSWTQELKGFAILAIIFAHIGYYLSADPRFLFPFSILAGVGVNLFFFLSGYGLTFSQMKKNESILQFYKRRLPKLFVPFWVVLSVLVALDFFVLGKTYSLQYLLKAFLGIFTSANMYTDINSPLWYFTLILLYYILFRLFFIKKMPWLTALLLYAAIWSLVKAKFPFFNGVIGLYEVHMLSFPLGVLLAWLVVTYKSLLEPLKITYKKYEQLFYPLALLSLMAVIGYFAIYSNVGKAAYLEQWTSLLVVAAILLLFLIKKRESKILSVFGMFSYEIYLFHWPLLYRYDFLYPHFPAALATLMYLGLFIALSVLLQKVSTAIFTMLRFS